MGVVLGGALIVKGEQERGKCPAGTGREKFHIRTSKGGEGGLIRQVSIVSALLIDGMIAPQGAPISKHWFCTREGEERAYSV